MMPDTPYMYIAVRHGVILAAGATRAAAAAAAATRVSRCEIRHGSALERRMARRIVEHGRQRALPQSERALLEAIHADIHRVLGRDECGPDDIFPEPDIYEYRALDAELRVDMDTRHMLDDAERARLEARADAILDELDELAFLERQTDLFAAVPA